MLLEKGGYTYLDVRPTMQLEEAGRVRRGVNVPFVQVGRSAKERLPLQLPPDGVVCRNQLRSHAHLL